LVSALDAKLRCIAFQFCFQFQLAPLRIGIAGPKILQPAFEYGVESKDQIRTEFFRQLYCPEAGLDVLCLLLDSPRLRPSLLELRDAG
jgi:hypothetical protein